VSKVTSLVFLKRVPNLQHRRDNAKMSNEEYTRVALDENEVVDKGTDGIFEQEAHEKNYRLKNSLGIFALILGIFAVGFMAGGTWTGIHQKRMRVKENGLLTPQSFIPESWYFLRYAEVELILSSPNEGGGLQLPIRL
jgi:hypothetical protein